MDNCLVCSQLYIDFKFPFIGYDFFSSVTVK